MLHDLKKEFDNLPKEERAKAVEQTVELKMVAGAYMNEENIGNNAISVIIKSA